MQISRYQFKVIFYLVFAVLGSCKSSSPHASHGPSSYVSKQPFSTPQQRLALFEKLGIKYVSKLQFSKDCMHLASITPETYGPYQGQKAYFDQSTVQYGHLIAQGYVAPVSIQWINEKVGYGLFAGRAIAQGAFIMEYTGKVVKKLEDTTWSWSYPPGGIFLNQTSSFSLDAKACGNEARFANHSDVPNMDSRFVFQDDAWHIIYVANRDIQKGEQLFISYGGNYWKTRNKLTL